MAVKHERSQGGGALSLQSEHIVFPRMTDSGRQASDLIAQYSETSSCMIYKYSSEAAAIPEKSLGELSSHSFSVMRSLYGASLSPANHIVLCCLHV